MTGRGAVLLLALLVTPPPNLAAAAAPPEGFRWQRVDALDAAFLVPDGWRAVLSQGKLLPTVSIFKPGEAAFERFRVGMTATAVDRLGRAGARPLTRQLAQYVDAIETAPQYRVLGKTAVRRGRYRGVTLRFRTVAAPRVQIQRLYLADERRDRLLIVQFEAPLRRWPAAWSIGRVLLSRLALN